MPPSSSLLRILRRAGFHPIKSPMEAQLTKILKQELDGMRPDQTRMTTAKSQVDLELHERVLRKLGAEIRKLKSGSIIANFKQEDGWRTFRVWAPESSRT